MNEQQLLEGQVRQWEAEGRWLDRGRWVRCFWHSELVYLPTRREIKAKCKLFRTINGWRGAHKRAPRGGEFGVATTAAGTVEEVVYKAKTNQLRAEAAKTDESLATLDDAALGRGAPVLALFDWSQRAADSWRGSTNAVRREILDAVCLNRTLGDANLVTQERKPFDVLAERLKNEKSRTGWTPVATFWEEVHAWGADIKMLLLLAA